MIPQKVKDYLAKESGDVLRQNKQGALDALTQLGIAPHSEFGDFYMEHQGPFISPRPVAELYDLIEYSGIVDAIDYVKDRYQLEAKLLPLTSDESEGMYLYDKESGTVSDFYLRDYKAFMTGQIPPRWKTFGEFLLWYFDENAAEKD